MPTLPLGDHQDRALDFIANNRSGLIEYGTGTGKTRIMAEALKMMLTGGEMPLLAICPNSVLEQMYDQLLEWAGRTWTEKYVGVLDSRYDIYRRREALKRVSMPVLLLSHEAMSYPLIRDGLTSHPWATVLLDEASRFRNSSNRTRTLRSLGLKTVTRYAFTGNLTVRSPADCWYITSWLQPGVWGTRDRKTFITKYFMLGGFTGVEPVGLRPDRADEFMAILDSLRIQCELRDLRSLPPRELTIRYTNMGRDQQRAYDQMRRELKVEIERTNDDTFLSNAKTYATRLLRLQEIAAGFTRNVDGEFVLFPSPKTKEMVEAIMDDIHTPTIIWYWFRPEVELIQAELAKQGLQYRRMGQPGAVKDFMSGKVPIFLSQTARGGLGLNLTVAERMEYHTLLWDLDIYTQSQERNMRLNTPDPKRGSLEIVHNIVKGTCEEYVRNRLVGKADMSRKFSRSQALEMLR